MIFDTELIYGDKLYGGDVGHRGILLSYGDSNHLTPVGTFVISSFIKPNGELISDFELEFKNGFAVLEEVILDGYDLVPKKPGNTLVIPATEYYKLFGLTSTNNYQISEYATVNEGPTPENAEIISQVAAEYLAKMPEGTEIDGLEFDGMTIDESGAMLIGADGKERGTNYSLFPFDPAKVLHRVLVLTPDEENGRSLGR